MARIRISDVLAELIDYRDNLRSWGEDCGDVRLQVVDGDWSLHTGDAQYDDDHRGDWGAATIDANATDAELREVARDLIAEARDSAACR